MKYYFGLDGGGTKSRIIVENEWGTILSKAEGGSTNQFAVGLKKAVKNASSLIRLSLPSISSEDRVYGTIGSAGLFQKEDEERFMKELKPLLPPGTEIALTDDAVPLLEGGAGRGNAIALIAGTGSICTGRKEGGRPVRAGGYGWRLGDEGSGWWITKEAIRRTLRSEERRDIWTTMKEDLLRFFKMPQLQDFIPFINDDKTEKSLIAKGAPIVLEAYKRKDSLASSIIIEAADELTMLTESVYERTGMKEGKLIMCGGLLENAEEYRELVEERIRKRLPLLEILPHPLLSAEEGALIIAKRTFS